MPVEAWDPYVVGVSRWLAWNAIALRTVHVRFEVRRGVLLCAVRCAHEPVHDRDSRRDLWGNSW